MPGWVLLGDALKSNSTFSGRWALTGVAAATLWLAASNAYALGLGRLSVQSALGEALRAEIDVTSLTPEEAGTLRVRVAAPEAYRAAGVEYNPVLPATNVELQRRADGRPYLRVTSDRAVQEPFVDVILEISWASGRLVREYTMLFDPPAIARAPAPVPSAPAAAAVIAAAPPAAAPAKHRTTPAPAGVACRRWRRPATHRRR
jgi:pilus assembly protein FimV